MNIDEIFLGIILVGGLFIGFFGINFYRIACIIMNGATGYVLGRMLYDYVVGNVVGEGVFREMDASAGYSFVIAVFVLGGAALGYFFYQIMSPLCAAIGGGFLFARLFQVLMGRDISSAFIGAVIGGFLGIIIALIAFKFEKVALIVFTSLIGARFAGYSGAYFLATTGIGKTIANPFVGTFAQRFPGEATQMAIFLELYVVLLVLGIVVQLIIRDD